MSCRACGAENAPDMKFCTQCGAALAVSCSSCEFDNPPGSRFCGRCGTPLSYQAERWPGEIHLTISSLDQPEDFPPTAHVFTEERIPWLDLGDDLPRHPRSAGDDDSG